MPYRFISAATTHYYEVFFSASRTKNGDLVIITELFIQLIECIAPLVGSLHPVAYLRLKFPPTVSLLVSNGGPEVVKQPFVNGLLGRV